MNDCILFFMLF